MFLLFIRVGLPEEILTKQGSCFMYGLMKRLCQSLKVRQIKTSVYPPQTDGLVERFNQTLKHMLRKVVDVDGTNWDQLLPHVLFSILKSHRVLPDFHHSNCCMARDPEHAGCGQGSLGAAAVPPFGPSQMARAFCGNGTSGTSELPDTT